MPNLPHDFLIEIAREYQLSPEQEDAFVERFSTGKSELAIAQDVLHISPGALRNRMREVYRKFSIGINQRRPNKSHELRNFLIHLYQKRHGTPIPEDPKADIDDLVQEVRQSVKPHIQERCGTMRVLDMTYPIGLNEIYTNVNILEKITGRRRKEIAELLPDCHSEEFYRFGLGKIAEERVPGLDAVNRYAKLLVLGKPGSGKTTFLKYVAIQCNGGELQSVRVACAQRNRVPIFITLKYFAEAPNQPVLLKYICQQFSDSSREETLTATSQVIAGGRALILLDGLDEVRDADCDRVIKEIRNFSDRYRDNHFVMTCRIAASEYTFEKFAQVEMADFDEEQILTFATKWFNNKAVKPERFMERLEENDRTKELATNPLLLTLLCLAFEESGEFPANRSELYKEGLDALLKKWDAKRGIHRDQVYKKLSPQRKEDLLSKLALTTFEGSNYFFKQKVAEQYITEYIRNLPNASNDEETLQLDSEAVLKSIEAQHGLLVERAKSIYSFSHLTFHEYFTAREIIVGKQSSEEALQNLVSHITDYRWREVFFLAVEMSPNADRLLLLMKEKVDAIVAADEKLHEFMMWVQENSRVVDICYRPLASRAFYISTCCLLGNFSDISRTKLMASKATFVDVLNQQIFDLFNCRLVWNPYDKASIVKIETLKHESEKIFKNWQLSDKQKKMLDRYYKANKFLVECLNSDCYVSREVRQEIEDTLFLPIAEIEKRKQQTLSRM